MESKQPKNRVIKGLIKVKGSQPISFYEEDKIIKKNDKSDAPHHHERVNSTESNLPSVEMNDKF